MNEIALISPAKVNLTFAVLSKRGDGYHNIASHFQAVDLYDELTFTLADVDHFTSDSPPLENNLILRALELFREFTGWDQKVHIQLKKRIPIGAGLGGGSSNAATTLYALRALSGLEIDDIALQAWGAEIGSDVPFFFSSGTAICKGRGELVESISHLAPEEFYLAIPDFGMSTVSVYKECAVGEVSHQSLLPLYFNDLQPAACRIEPKMLSIYETLKGMEFAHVVMSGSGSSFVCMGEPKKPFPENLTHHKVKTLTRVGDGWYESRS